MSNLLKAGTIAQTGNKRVIDYNELIEIKMERLAAALEANKEKTEDGFVPGLHADRVELLLEDLEEIENNEAPQPTDEEIMEEAKKAAEALIAEAKRESENIRKKAFEEGRNAGYNEGKESALAEVEQQKNRMEAEIASIREEYSEKQKEMEPMLVAKIAEIFESVFHIQFDDKVDMIINLLEASLEKIENSKEYRIHISKEDFSYVMMHRERIESYVVGANQIDIIEDNDLRRNQCLIETDIGVFECSLDIQLENLVKALKILSYSTK